MDLEGSKYNWRVLINMMVHFLWIIRWHALDSIVEHLHVSSIMKFLYAFTQMIQQISIIATGSAVKLIRIRNMFLLMLLVETLAFLNSITLMDLFGKTIQVFNIYLMDKMYWMQLQVVIALTHFQMNIWIQEYY